MEPGETYSYRFRAEWMRDGKRVRVTKKVVFRAGQTVTVEFRDAPGSSLPPQRKSRVQPAPSKLRLGEEQTLLELTNKEREKEDLPPLQLDPRLSKAAREHSANMAKQGKLDHMLDDQGPAERIRDAGYEGFGWGENIAFGQPTPASAIEVWMNSPGHRANILGKHYNEIGIGIVRDNRGIPYYTQVFGRSR